MPAVNALGLLLPSLTVNQQGCSSQPAKGTRCNKASEVRTCCNTNGYLTFVYTLNAAAQQHLRNFDTFV